MNRTNPKVEIYFKAGCGRCSLFNTPECKVHNWPEELAKLRQIMLECGLTEELKWGVPCNTFEGNNVAIIGAFKEYCSMSFFKGVLLKDTDGVLTKQGENSQAAQLIKFTDVRKIIESESVIKAYIREAVEVEKARLKVKFKETSEYAIPEEFQNKLAEIPALKSAFESLTPGRQRGYILHFSQPKQSKPRVERIKKCLPQILMGKGLNDC
jgi:uncharacterized protein YdeI (YjbR/CyaY-like superfamily)